MRKEDVIIERFDEDNSAKVLIIPYDIKNHMVMGTSIEVLTRDDACDNYNVVGEMIEGDIRIYDENVEPIENYSEYFDDDEETE